MTITISDRVWKWVALVLFGLLIFFLGVWPVVKSGMEAHDYLQKCILAGVCPTYQQLTAAIESKNPKPSPTPSPPPSPLPAEKGK